MKLPITKIKKALRKANYDFSVVEVSFFELNDGGSTANMLVARDDAPIVDAGTLARNDVYNVDDDGLGLVKLDLRLVSKDYSNTGYVDCFVFDGTPYIKKLPAPLDTELGRAIYLKTKKGAAA